MRLSQAEDFLLQQYCIRGIEVYTRRGIVINLSDIHWLHWNFDFETIALSFM